MILTAARYVLPLALTVLLAACGTLGIGSGNAPADPAAAQAQQAQRVVAFRADLGNAKFAVAAAEALADGICASRTAPKVCSDPKAQAAYADAKAAVAAAFAAADDALAKGPMDDATLTKLASDLATTAARIEALVYDFQNPA